MHESRKTKGCRPYAAAFLALALMAAPVQPARAIDAEVVSDTANLPHWVQQFVEWGKSLAALGNIFTGIMDFMKAAGIDAAISRATNTAGQQMGVKATFDAAQFEADANTQTSRTEFAAQEAADAQLSEYSTVCAVRGLTESYDRVRNAMEGLAAADATQTAGEGKGLFGNIGGPRWEIERFNDLCQLGFLSETDYGDLTAKAGCRAHPRFVHSHLKLQSVVPNSYQYVLPKKINVLQDGYRSFTGGAGAAAITLSDDERSFVAARKYCENLAWPSATPVRGSGRQLTAADIHAIMEDQAMTAPQLNALNLCINEVWYRTACPANALDAAKAVGEPENCHKDQEDLCKRLKNMPDDAAVSGMGIIDGFPELADCEQNGLSQAAADHIMAYQCKSENLIEKVLPRNMTAMEIEHYTRVECPAMQRAFDAEQKRRKAELTEAVRNFWEQFSAKAEALPSSLGRALGAPP